MDVFAAMGDRNTFGQKRNVVYCPRDYLILLLLIGGSFEALRKITYGSIWTLKY